MKNKLNDNDIKKINIFLNDYSLYVDNIDLKNNILIKIKKDIFLISNELYKHLNEFNNNNVKFAGLYMGDIDGKFSPSFNFLDLICDKVKNKKTINKTKEFLFLCGRDLTDDSFSGKTDGRFLVLNNKGNILGIVKKIKNDKKQKNFTKIFFKNILDKGIILRREFTHRHRQ